MRPSPARSLTLVSLLCISGAADDSPAGDLLPLRVSGARGGKPYVLVLPNGLTICGDIRRTSSGYSVALGPNTGRTVINERFVWFTAPSLPAAYKKLEKRWPDKTAAGHLDLARWCLEQGLLGQARENIEDALQLEPHNDQARVLAKKLGRLEYRQEESRQRQILRKRPAPSDGELMGRYVDLIQPMLLNGCGNAKCHGRSSSNPFRLVNVRRGGSSFQQVSEANYAAVLQQIDKSAPNQSPLIQAPHNTRHAAANPSLFDGPTGERRWQALREWVIAVAQTGGGQNTDSLEEVGEQAGNPFHDKPPSQPRSPSQIVQAGATLPAATAPRKTDRVSDAEIDAILEKAIQSGQPDLFAPSAFNRRFAPQTELSSPPTPLSHGPTR